MNHKTSCKQAVKYLLKKEEENLSATERFQLWKHLSDCSLCRNFSSQNTIMSNAFKWKEPDELKSLTPEEKEKIIEAILAF